MKKLIASAGILVVGAGVAPAVNYGDLGTGETAKRWSATLALRGFYDDNYATSPSGLQQSSGGFQVNPTIAGNMPGAQTYLGAKLDYSMLYYFDRPGSKVDHNLSLDLKMDHRFNERQRLRVEDIFTYSKEPELLDRSGTVTTPLRSESDGIRNFLPMEFSWQLTRLFSLELGYHNTYYRYFDDQKDPNTYASRLNRWEHNFHIDARWQLQPHTVGLVGYAVGLVDYTSGATLFPAATFTDNSTFPPTVRTFKSVKAEDRNNFSQSIYLGGEHDFSSDLNVGLKVGASFNNYYNADQTDVSPFVDLALSWTYLPGNLLRLGLRQAHNSTDVVTARDSSGEISTDQDTTTVYGSITHRITPKLTGTFMPQFQHSVYTGGTLDGQADDYLSLALMLDYRFNYNWSAEIKYYFDYLTSSAINSRDFTRNRIYAGVRLTY